jgi:Ubiquitin-activating enzyme E1 FCCH domain
MADFRAYQPSFTAGELSPALWARVDLAKYTSGLKTAVNLFIHPHGGVSNRAGLEFITEVKNSADAARLVPFQFNTEQSYILEYGNQYARVIRDGGVVLEGAPITGVSKANPGVVTAPGHPFENGDLILIAGVVGMTELNGHNFTVAGKTATTFQLQGVNTTGYGTYGSGGMASGTSPYEFATPYAPADLSELVYIQEADVMYQTHVNHAPRKLSRLADNNWALTAPTFAPTLAAPAGPAAVISGITKANPAVVTATAHGFANGETVTIAGVVGMPEVNGNTYTVGAVAANTFQLNGINSSAYGTYGSGGTATGTTARARASVGTGTTSYSYKVAAIRADTDEESLPSPAGTVTNDLSIAGNKNTIAWSMVPGVARYVVYKLDNGVYGYIGGTEGLSFVDDNIVADLADTPQMATNPFAGTGNFPRCATFVDQRLAFASSLINPQAVWLSQSANYENFGRASPAKESDAITFRIRARQVNEIRSLLPMRGLMVLTSGAEWIVQGADTRYLTQNVQIDNQGYRGASKVQPIVVGNTVLFSQARGGVVRDFSYEFSEDSFTGKDLTILARHLFEGRDIKAWAYAQAPHSIVYVVLDDGTLVTLTFMKEHDVWGWTRQETGGRFEDVAVIAEGGEDVPYFIVRRTIDGVSRRFIERLHTRQFETVADAFFVDSGLSYYGPPVSQVRIEHLPNTALVALVDGNVVRNLTSDAEGDLTLPYAGSTIHLGLAYEAALETLDLDMGVLQNLGSVQARWKSVSEVTMRVEKTRGIWTGPSPNQLTEYKQRAGEAWSEAIAPFTGDISITPQWDWTKGGTIWVKQFDPLPMTILSLMPDVTLAR